MIRSLTAAVPSGWRRPGFWKVLRSRTKWAGPDGTTQRVSAHARAPFIWVKYGIERCQCVLVDQPVSRKSLLQRSNPSKDGGFSVAYIAGLQYKKENVYELGVWQHDVVHQNILRRCTVRYDMVTFTLHGYFRMFQFWHWTTIEQHWLVTFVFLPFLISRYQQ